MPRIMSGTIFLQSIADAPIARDLPRLNAVVVTAHALPAGRITKELAGLDSGRLHGPQFVGTARHDHALSPVPLPVETEPRVRHRIRGRAKLRVLPRLSAVESDVHLAHRACPRPREAADLAK